MDKDIFIDNNVAVFFCNPIKNDYKAFYDWLFEEGILAASNGIIHEYVSSQGQTHSSFSIIIIIAKLQKDGRLKKFTKRQLSNFKIRQSIQRCLRSNIADHDHLKVVLLSDRRYAVSLDVDFRYDVNNYPRYNARAVAHPEELPYSE